MKEFIKSSLRACNVGLTRYSTLERLRAQLSARESAAHDLALLLALPNEHATLLIRHLPQSKSQLRQDLFVLSQLDFKRNGFFVEFGATNGVDLSNTYLLEKEFAWRGILAEPARGWHADLQKNRQAHIETKCVWSDSNSTLKFKEAVHGELSTIESFTERDEHGVSRKRGATYDVQTISLRDLLRKYDAPTLIDYLSIDTEGSEFDILEGFEFNEYAFRVISCEHNFTPMREKIAALLENNGYERKFPELSKFDDWYVKRP